MVRNEDLSSLSKKEVVCVDLTDSMNAQFNATLFYNGGCLNVNDSNLDAPTQRILSNNKEKFEVLARRVGRMHSRAIAAGSGVTFAVAPGK